MKNFLLIIFVVAGTLFSANLSAATHTWGGTGWTSVPIASPYLNTDDYVVNGAGATFPAGINTNDELASGGSITVNSGGIMDLTGFTFISGCTVLVNTGGILNVTASGFVQNGTVLNNSANFTINGVVNVFAGLGTFENGANGDITINTGGELNLSVLFFTNTGNMLVDGLLAYGTLGFNTGTITGNGVINSGGLPLFNTGSVGGATGGVVTMPTSPNNAGDPTYVTYAGGTYPVTDCFTKLDVASDLTLNSNLSVAELFVRPGVTLTIVNNTSINVCSALLYNGLIENEGSIVVQTGGSIVQVESAANTGSGSYKVYQTGTIDVLKYNVWSSPVNAMNIGGTGIAGGGVFASSNPCDIYYFDPSTLSWLWDFPTNTPAICSTNPSAIINGTGDGVMNVTRGYFVPGDNSTGIREFTGEINNGNFTTSDPIVSGVDNESLIGNPYPSGLDAASFLSGNSNLNGTIWFWNDQGAGPPYSNSDFATWNSTGTTGTPAPTGIIGVAQGFWVQANTSGGTISFNNSMRSSTNNQFFKAPIDVERFWVEVAQDQGASNEILVGFTDQATDQFDKDFDGHKKVGNTELMFASVMGNEEFAIQGLKPLNEGETKVVDLVLNTNKDGVHVFTLRNTENVKMGHTIKLVDKVANKTIDISTASYTLNLSKGTYTDRFQLIFGAESITSVEDLSVSNYTLINQNNLLTISNQKGINGDVQVFDINGRLIVSTYKNANQIQIDLNAFDAGVYIIKISNDSDANYTEKVVKL